MRTEAAIDSYLASRAHRCGPRWLASQRRVLHGFVQASPPTTLRRIGPDSLEAWQARRLAQVKRSTVLVEYRIIRSWIRWLRRHGHLPSDPGEVADAPPPAPRLEVRFLSREEYARLIHSARPPIREMIAVAVYAGLRPGEIRALRWRQIRGEVIEIRPGDGWRPKFGRERRVPLHPDLATVLEERRNRKPKEAGALIFQTSRGTPYIQQDILRSLKTAARRAGISPPPDWRTLRHTFASWLAMEGVSIYHIARFLGHSSVTTTERHYAGLRPEILRDQIERLGRMPGVSDSA